jgi:hypothetical protein
MDKASAAPDAGLAPGLADAGLARTGRRTARPRSAILAWAAALAAVCVIAGGALATGGATGGHAPAAYGSVRPLPYFNPLIPYLQFGWLPAGESLDGGETVAANAQLTAGPSGAWALTAFAAGRCNLTSLQVLEYLRQGQQPRLTCVVQSGPSGVTGWTEPVTRQAPFVRGHLAFWTAGGLAWQYARDSWADLSGAPAVATSDMLKVADGIRYGVAARPSIRFPVQLTGLPAAWQIEFVSYVPDGAVLRASNFLLANGDLYPPSFTIGPATARNSCTYWPGQSRRTAIDGHQVTVSYLRQTAGSPSTQQVCAPDADGLSLIFATYDARATPDGVGIFAKHTRLLGTDPADWTTRPLS